jgi:parallel beta-helix repeat protein
LSRPPQLHRPITPLYVKANLTLTGEFGAEIDGTGVRQAWDAGGVAIIQGWNCDPVCPNVTIRNLKIYRTGPYVSGEARMCIGMFGRSQWRQPPPASNSDRWTIEHNDVSGCWGGIILAGSGEHRIAWNRIRDNINNWGGYLVHNSVYEDNDVSRGTELHNGKWGDSDDVVLRRNFVHDYAHEGAMIWFDGGHRALIEDNRIECTTGWPCIDIEIHIGAVIRRNTITIRPESNAGGVFIPNSQDTLITENIFTGANGVPFAIFWDGIDRTTDPSTGTGWPNPVNNRIVGNTFNMGTTNPQHAIGYQCSGTNPNCLSFLMANNGYDFNAYHAPADTLAAWYLNSNAIGWAQWQQAGQDVNGTLNDNPPPPPPPAEVCGDGIDNDDDGLIDEGCPPPPTEICGDGIDNDGDGMIDEGCAPPGPTCTLDGVTYDEGERATTRVRRAEVSAWVGLHPEWLLISATPVNRVWTMILVECRP